jgi:hypothetical protein
MTSGFANPSSDESFQPGLGNFETQSVRLCKPSFLILPSRRPFTEGVLAQLAYSLHASFVEMETSLPPSRPIAPLRLTGRRSRTRSPNTPPSS